MTGLLILIMFAQTEDQTKIIQQFLMNVPQPQITEPEMSPQYTPSALDSAILLRQIKKSEIEIMYEKYFTYDTLDIGKPYSFYSKDIIRLKQFGYEYFLWNVKREEPPALFVTEDYVIGPDDQLSIMIWGLINKNITLKVDKEGKIYLEDVGPIYVWGLKYNEVRELLKNKLSQTYSNVSIEVTFSSLRRVNVLVIGNLFAPGNYTITPVSTIIYALLRAGGPDKLGTFRRIKIIPRIGKETEIDLYDYYVYGKSPKQIQFNDGDIIFVPTIGRVVGIAGAVKRAAIYELKEGESFKELLDMCGGLLPGAYVGKITIYSVKDNIKIVIYEKDYDSYDEFKKSIRDVKLNDGDLVYITPIPKIKRNNVNISGNVYYPGDYEITKDITLKKLLLKAGLKENTYLKRGEIRRYKTDILYDIIPFNIESVMAVPEYDTFKFKEWDRIIVYSIDEIIPPGMVYIYGAVSNPGSYVHHPNMTIEDLIFRGHPSMTAELHETELLRVKRTEKGYQDTLIRIDLTKEENMKMKLNNQDMLIIKSGQYKPQVVTIIGEVKYPGAYTIKKNETLKELIERAGGLTPDAYIMGLFLSRKTVKMMQRTGTEELILTAKKDLLSLQSEIITSKEMTAEELRLKQALFIQQAKLLEEISKEAATGRVALPMAKLDIFLEDGDSIYIPKIPSTIQVIGAVFNSQGVVYYEGIKLSDVINMAGGLRPDADRGRIYVIRASGETEKRIKKLRPGDTVVVPVKSITEKPFIDYVKDFSLIIYQLGIALAAIITLLRK